MIDHTVRSIPTVHRGRRFRSRLEARWSVFLEAIGIRFEYEYEGFEDTVDGQCYLPDFNLVDLGLFAEVKPVRSTNKDQFDKAIRFVRHGMADRIMLLKGSPDFIPYDLYRKYECLEPEEFYRTNAVLDIHTYRKAYSREHRLFEDVTAEDWTSERDFSEEYRMAIYAARSFNFGRVEYPTGIELSGPGLRIPF